MTRPEPDARDDPSDPSGTAASSEALALLACCLWGFAEATFFFVIPDVFLTWLALRRPRLALRGCVAATLGALAGGALLLAWSVRDHPAAVAAVDRVPFVPTDMVQQVEDDLRARGAPATMEGPWIGKPYKLYAVQAPAAGVPAWSFLAISAPARVLRFLALTLVAGFASRQLARRWPHHGRRSALAIWSLAWVVTYAVYWTSMSQ